MPIIEYNEQALSHLKKVDPLLGYYIDKYGFITINRNPNVFETIVSSIIAQQLSMKAAQTIESRFVHLLGAFEPLAILSQSEDELRACGLSRPKIRYIRELSQKVWSHEMNLDDLDTLSDAQLIERLVSLNGIGRWTAEMLAMFSLGRLDIFAYDDLALKKAVMKVQGYKTFSKLRYERLRKKYSPYGTVASIYYYAVNDREKNT